MINTDDISIVFSLYVGEIILLLLAHKHQVLVKVVVMALSAGAKIIVGDIVKMCILLIAPLDSLHYQAIYSTKEGLLKQKTMLKGPDNNGIVL